MRIVDYETGRELHDVALTITDDELDDLTIFLDHLKRNRNVNHAHLTQINGAHLERELTVALERPLAS